MIPVVGFCLVLGVLIPGGAQAKDSPAQTIEVLSNGSRDSTFRFNDGFSPDELVLQVDNPGQNTLQLRNTNPRGFSALSVRGTDPFDADPEAVFEHLAFGWSNPGGIAYLEVSSFDNTRDPGKPPSRFLMQQTGGIDPTGGVVRYCDLTQGSTQLHCTQPVPPVTAGQYVFSFNLPSDTKMASGAGTTSPVLDRASITSQKHALVRFWEPVYRQYPVFELSRDNEAWFNNWDRSRALVINRASKSVTLTGGTQFRVRQVKGANTSDTASVHDHFIFWNDAATGARSEVIPACTGELSGLELVVADERRAAASHPITIRAQDGTVNQAASTTIGSDGGRVHLVCDGAGNWVEI
ncbi:hypothetical protein MTR62_15980 [Novosphingobium sp. 1949]|uniref:Uncharacterized protein n=1 Tax=Novosphingobium organovorum TaxID=2930092 RepID=A0ABT0BGT1_9SPHN|nr:hypothetical protein [Novosphingobium organovorum]MCJ2184178.1 hypothetical protein [Novosphingobium organovorum]